MRAVRDHGRPMVQDPARLAGVSALGVDEIAFLTATATHATEFVTGIVDLTGPALLLDVVAGRSGKALSDWVSPHDQAWRDGIAVAALGRGGVIASAGVVLAGTFAVLGTLPVVFLAELGFAVALGMLLDTIVVRSVLVMALNLEVGRHIWWPSTLTPKADVETWASPGV